MDLNKSYEFFDPTKVDTTCQIIGCGAIGSNIAELLIRQGVENIDLWDFDHVDSHNVVNQLYTDKDIGKEKTKCLSNILKEINPDVTIQIHNKYEGQPLYGYIFMCVDSVKTRKEILENNKINEGIIAVFDTRMTLTEGQAYVADWTNRVHRENLLKSLDFTDEEAKANTPITACGFELSVAPTVKAISCIQLANFTNLINGEEFSTFTVFDPYNGFYVKG